MSATSPRPLVAGAAAALVAGLTGVAILLFPGFASTPGLILFFGLFIGAPIAAAHGAIVGGPLYYFAGRRWPLRWWNAALGGFVTGMIPVTTLWLMQGADGLFAGHPFQVEPVAAALLLFGGSGAVGGLVFRAIRGPRPASAR